MQNHKSGYQALRSGELVRPFLKWAGGKYRLIDRISDNLPSGKRLIEPFIGSGSVFLNTRYDNYLLADINPDLIFLYQTLKDEGRSFIDYCESFFQPELNNAARYYQFREEFNELMPGTRKAALFLYFNRHGYNGLCRYNLKGGFNVPFGKYKKPYFPRLEMEHFWKKAQRATFVCQDFEKVMQRARKDHVVYCDPPYVPISPTAYFTSYAKHGFSLHDQERLAFQAKKLSQRQVTVVISNHENEVTRAMYQGAKIVSFPVRRFISCNGSRRNNADELLAIFTKSL
ncbi:Dam family site-specific DNA-(adenine-N6)-methyltransferase [Pleionea mediterranea]|uniref:Site-specific DNA-methyltransferase (adenine-specific) n=1 Tax=Pleionea mediterranea TaxID=523701 RepID=A0A316FUD6_9GAMM|nr:Dam family site-specific DNA-(adenine-N6)-methyltransferase [Pleionea mediterranea]PWK51705.1 DNA adenine methylase Dam [Pleionea mediterranea]